MKKLIGLLCLIPLSIVLTITDCASTSSSPVRAQSTGEPFSLRVGESASVAEADLSLTFSAVTQDSRCPRDVNCIVAGEAVLVFEAFIDGERVDLTFKVPPGGRDAQELDELTITVVELQPEAESGKRIETSSYVAKLIVTTAN